MKFHRVLFKIIHFIMTQTQTFYMKNIYNLVDDLRSSTNSWMNETSSEHFKIA